MSKRKRVTLTVVLSILIVVLGIAAVGGIYALTLANSFNGKTSKIEDPFPDEASRPAVSTSGAQNILLLGSDTRGDNGDAELDSLTGQRSDTMMVVNISGDRQDVSVMSIMRDSYVELPGKGFNKINAALALGGPSLAVSTVENLLGVRIDHVAVVDFEGFKGLVDAVGGIEINNPIAFTATHGKQRFAEGPIQLNGTDSLSFVRERYAFQDGDFQRARNQQIVLKGIMAKLLSKDTLTNPGRISGSVDAIAPFLTVDHGLNAGWVMGLAPGLVGLRNDDIIFFSVPTAGTGTSPDGQSIVRIDQPRLDEVKAAFAGDTVGEWATANKK